jgi:hypothetical protein
LKHFLKDFRFLNLANPLTCQVKSDITAAISPPIPGVASRGAWIMSKKWLVLLAVSAGAIGLTACAKKTEEAASDAAVAVDEAVEATGEAVDATADAAGEVVDAAAAATVDATMDAAGEVVDDAAAAVEGAVDDADAMMDKAADDAGAMMDKAEEVVEEATTDAPGQR